MQHLLYNKCYHRNEQFITKQSYEAQEGTMEFTTSQLQSIWYNTYFINLNRDISNIFYYVGTNWALLKYRMVVIGSKQDILSQKNKYKNIPFVNDNYYLVPHAIASPAFINYDHSVYYNYGFVHREDGPAVIYPDNPHLNKYYLKDKIYYKDC